jgi:hypothetical protein
MVKTNNLSVFLKSKARDAKERHAPTLEELQERQEKWLERVDNLYKKIRGWLSPLEKEGDLSIFASEITLNEPPLPAYDVEVLTIIIGDQRVSFVPKGTLIIGAEGRVDIKGHKGIRTIIFSGEKWSLVERTPKLKLLTLDQKSFQDILNDVME